MAARENQGLQAIVIVLTIFVLLLGVGLLLVNNARKTAVAQAKSAEDRASPASTDAAKQRSEAEAYKQWIGFDEAQTYESLQELQKQDMEKFGASMEVDSRRYRTILDNIYQENRNLVVNEANAKQQLKELKERYAALEIEKQKQVQSFQAEMEKSKTDAATSSTKFAEDREAMQAEKERLATELKGIQAKHEEAIAALEGERSQLNNQMAKLERSLTLSNARAADVDQFAQPPDGRVTWVNQQNGVVWIDLGADDGLRPQVTFAVAEDALDDVAVAKKKGSIEVTRVIDGHMSEARITSDNAIDPLMPGDRIYSQVWDRGRQVGFAIAGFVDIDKDTRSDLAQLKAIITSSNGRIDAAPDEKGKLQGELQADTRMLIVGEVPNRPGLEGFRTSWDALTQEAQRLEIETVPVDEFLALMGWQLDAKSIPMNDQARAADFPPEPRGPEMDQPRKLREPAGVFKKRLPGVSY